MSESYRAYASFYDASFTTGHTFSGVDIGSASATRTVVVALSLVNGVVSSVPPNPSVTIGGISAPLQKAKEDTSAFQTGVYIFAANVPTGATANIVVSITNPDPLDYQYAIGVWALDSVASTAARTASSVANPISLNLNTSIGTAVVAAAYTLDVPPPTWTWVGLTEKFDVNIEADGASSFTGASLSAGSASTPLTITATPTSSALMPPIGVVAAFDPAVSDTLFAQAWM